MLNIQVTAAIFACIFAHSRAQEVPCVYQGGPTNEYTLNLTNISFYTMALVTPDYNYYYTPCGNREICTQNGNQTASNIVQYNRKTDQCENYLSIDNKQSPKYAFYLASWEFNFANGQICKQTKNPITTTVYYTCDTYGLNGDAWFYAAEQDYNNACAYELQVRSPLACVPENQLNSKCQWQFENYTTKTTYNLDLSSFSGIVINATQNNNNTGGYLHYYSPCGNNIQCYQSAEETPNVMAKIENTKTGACDTYLAVWEEGRHQPIYDADKQSWEFHYKNGRKCEDGNMALDVITYYCDESIDDIKVMSAQWNNNCFWQLNLATKLVCQNANRGKIFFHSK